MNAASSQIQNAQDGIFVLAGRLVFDTVPHLSKTLNAMLSKQTADHLVIDFSHIEYADSAAVALMLDVLRHARKIKKELRFQNLSDNLLEIAALSHVDAILPLERV